MGCWPDGMVRSRCPEPHHLRWFRTNGAALLLRLVNWGFMTKVHAVLLAVVCWQPLYSADALAAGRRLPGVMVDSASVEPGMASGVGIKSYVLAPGDILRFYSCDGKPQPIESPLDMPKLDVARFSCKHELVLTGRRNGIARNWRVSQGARNVQVGPRFEGPDERLYKTGVELANRGKREEAVQKWALIESQESWWPWWRELHSAALFANAREWKRSDELFDKALALIPRDNHVWKAEAFYLWAQTYDTRTDWNDAEQRYRKAAEVDDSEIPQLRKLQYRYGVEVSLCLKDASSQQPEQMLAEDLPIAEQLAPRSTLVALMLNFLGGISEGEGDLAQAEHYWVEALKIYEKWVPSGVDISWVINNLGTCRWYVGDYEEAQGYYRRALRLFRHLQHTSPKADPSLQLDVGIILHNLGTTAKCRGDFQAARKYYAEALAAENNAVPDGLDVADTLARLGEVAYDEGHIEQARDYVQQALEIYRRVGIRTGYLAITLKVLGDIEKSAGNLAAAKDSYQQALKIRRDLAPGTVAETNSLAALASLAHQEQRLDDAAQLYQRAIEVSESVIERSGGTDQTRARFRSEYEQYYKDYIAVLLDQNKWEDALQVFERLRARSLLEMLSRAQVTAANGVDPALLARKKQLQESMAAASDRRIRVATANHHDSSLQAIDEEIHGLVRNYQQVETEIAAKNPEYGTLTPSKPITVHELQNQVLDSDTVLLEYDLSPKQSHVWAVTTSSLRVYALAQEQEIDAIARKAYGLLTARNSGPIESWPRTDEALSETLDRLSRQVLDPVKEELSKKRIVVVPDGMLHYIPFSALTSTQSTHTLHREPLVIGHELIALPSASVLTIIRNNNSHRPAPENFLAVLADPVFSSSDPRVQRLSRGKQSVLHDTNEVDTQDIEYLKRATRDIAQGRKGAALPRLLFSRGEAQRIVRNIPTKRRLIALDFDANRTLATNPELGKYRIVHFATHAFLDERYPEATGLVLSLVDQRGRSQQGFLSLADIYNLRLPVDMVVLSGCDTGLGKLVKGEGFLGLTRGFMYAGASRVLASLWEVDDEATAAMMGAFYDELEAKHQAPATALRNAQQKMLRSARWKSPYYWAAFELQGDWK